ncbi:MAG TPA: alpha-galactosidase [Bacteroidota bacterium]|nr:alpha-galactosidase [Bacteroidota bacterium]
MKVDRQQMSYALVLFRIITMCCLCSIGHFFGNEYRTFGKTKPVPVFLLENTHVQQAITVQHDTLMDDVLRLLPESGQQSGSTQPMVVATDADFGLEVMYTDWQAPGKPNNAENPILLTKKDFTFVNQTSARAADGSQELVLYFKAKETTLELLITYRLGKNDFFARRSLAVSDTAFGHHFLRWMWPRRGMIHGVRSIVKAGGFGQPVALLMNEGGAFFGLEYPTADNNVESLYNETCSIRCGQEFGQVISSNWVQSEFVVEAVTPNDFVKDWFFKYVDAIRASPLRPFTLYNSWYDLRSPEYPRVPKEHWMSEISAMGMAKLLRENMIEKHNIKLDAFVLDDGWDVYESDWVLRKEQWPNGLKPLADELKKTNTTLGIWVGPTGGYSFRMRRVNWMKDHGYEVVGKTRDNSMLCLAGTRYSELFKKRVTDFTGNDGVGYFKWDGLQFSCSEPNHGHPVDIYSRRAVMESVIDKCRAVREKNPSTFLNITSGTWLSPWWVKYANTIWMQGSDYGFSDVPSISKRDGAITYRDFILYDDFKNLDSWFPIQNLMTHGIIKGKLESTGSPDEPLDKFADDALLYCARGVSMYELYISPDILSEGEWNTLAASLTWARDRFAILSSTYMIGGDPMKRESYGYVHFKGNEGIIAARNPFIPNATLDVELSAAQGLDPKASSLVVEKVYPTHWIAPRLYSAGDKLSLPLDGYETAVYEIYPVEKASAPLVAGVMFDEEAGNGSGYALNYHSASPEAIILNPSVVKSMSVNGKNQKPADFTFTSEPTVPIVSGFEVTSPLAGTNELNVIFDLSETSSQATISILLTPDSSLTVKKKPTLSVKLDGALATVRQEDQEGKSQWYQIDVTPGKHTMSVALTPGKDEKEWKGRAYLWLIAQQKQKTEEISFTLAKDAKRRPMPPHPWKPGEVRKNLLLADVRLSASTSK